MGAVEERPSTGLRPEHRDESCAALQCVVSAPLVGTLSRDAGIAESREHAREIQRRVIARAKAILP